MAETVPWVRRALGVWQGPVDPWARAAPMAVMENMAFQEARAIVAILARPDPVARRDQRGLGVLKARWEHPVKMQSCAMKRVSAASQPQLQPRRSNSYRAAII